jgi:predicted nucleic acid-binding Zn ribbon protein
VSSEPPRDEGAEPPAREPASGEPPAGAEDEPAREPGQPPAPAICSTCGTPLDPDQTYCLECGSPTPLAPPLQRSQRVTVLIAAIVGALLIAVAVLATALATGDDSGPPGAATRTFATVVTDATISTGTPPFATSTLPADTSFTSPTAPATVPATTPPATGSASDWPSGRSGYTAVVSSVRSLSEATATKARVQGIGQPAGVLQSSDYSSLRPGYYVVFSGVFSTQAQAAAQARELASSFPGAYPRRVAP